MKSTWKVVSAGAVFLTCTAMLLSQEKPKAKSASEPVKTTSKTDYPVIGYLEKSDRSITIKSGPKGPLYSVKAADGKVLFENVSAEQLRAKAPELHQLIKTGMATSSGGKADARMRIKVDASMR
jgi:hypothetical protein